MYSEETKVLIEKELSAAISNTKAAYMLFDNGLNDAQEHLYDVAARVEKVRRLLRQTGYTF
jgi:hypothetical protein